jgi:flagellar protein FlbD
MIYLTRLNGQKIMINIDLLEFVEETPDTLITLTTGKKFLVKESSQQIRDEIIRFKRTANIKLKK